MTDGCPEEFVRAKKKKRCLTSFLWPPQRGIAYQPRVKPRVCVKSHSCVLKERHIGIERAHARNPLNAAFLQNAGINVSEYPGRCPGLECGCPFGALGQFRSFDLMSPHIAIFVSSCQSQTYRSS